jgi:cysteinyl-tRNA synthetase
MPLKIYNTLTRKKGEFVPLAPGSVGMYVCGPTVYGHSHAGHAKSYISFDIIVRYLRYLKYRVLYVQNITDVGHLTDDADEGEDKIEKQSRADRLHPMQVVETYTRSYFEDMDALNLLRPDISPRATGHIIEQISLVEELVRKGFAYEVNGSVYFDVSKDATYGKLSGRSTDEAESGTRVKVSADKRHPHDFALWKKAGPEHIMQWPSPWGPGFPGWHAECSAMSMKYLGQTFDIHGGGVDNVFPHHECEIAQSESVTGKPFARTWIHNNLVTVGGQKMGKSLGNVILLKDAFVARPPLVIRFFILQSHYRSTLDFTDEALDGAARGWEKLLNTIGNLDEAVGKDTPGMVSVARDRSKDPAGHGEPPGGGKSSGTVDGWRRRFLEAMDDDFNTPQAIAVLFDAAKEVNAAMAGTDRDPDILKSYNEFFREAAGSILGILPDGGADAGKGSIESGLLDFIVDLRAEVRKEKLWKLSDRIRDGLQEMGITIEDRKGGTTWKRT